MSVIQPDHIYDYERGCAASGRWVDSEDLRPGDRLRLFDGQSTPISSITTYPAKIKVYNLAVAEYHNYAVTASGVLVHNRAMKNTNWLHPEDLMNKPEMLRNSSIDDITNMFGNMDGWVQETMRKSTRHPDGGVIFRELNVSGSDYTGRLIQYHPGTPRHFGGEPYWKISGRMNENPIRLPAGKTE